MTSNPFPPALLFVTLLLLWVNARMVHVQWQVLSPHTHTHTQGSFITELECLVERRLFIGCLCLNWEQRWASDEDKTLSERVAFHTALVVIIITDFVVSYWLDHSTAKKNPFLPVEKGFVTVLKNNSSQKEKQSLCLEILDTIFNSSDNIWKYCIRFEYTILHLSCDGLWMEVLSVTFFQYKKSY